ncbi:hypothetical protein GURASL_31180 [Geotalea uraniireducens]|uniref:Uncharacterized protein n=1 Tax=Geotalea uraniireducens TaxID=351604 RepID=A0ABN6VYB3_9BACT|nr:hypothetical protein [Geotalea uraniireducens]BDV44195.1 hypothetical protein GURASL_31180 [Geotalea uraniireducens]
MKFSFIAGIILLALGSAILFAGVIALTFKNSDKEETPSVPYLILSIFTSLNYVVDFIKNLIEAPSNWREMKLELGLLGVGTVMTIAGLVLLFR